MRQRHYSIHNRTASPLYPIRLGVGIPQPGEEITQEQQEPAEAQNSRIRQPPYAPGLPLEVQPECQTHHQRRKSDADITL